MRLTLGGGGGVKNFNFDIFGVFRKYEYLFEIRYFWRYFLESLKNVTIFMGFILPK